MQRIFKKPQWFLKVKYKGLEVIEPVTSVSTFNI